MTWLSLDIAPAALLDELIKIGAAAEEESNKKRVLRALKTVVIGAAGSAAGIGAAELLLRRWPALDRFVLARPKITDRKLSVVRWGLPIAGGLAAILGRKYRKKVDEGLSAKPPNAR